MPRKSLPYLAAGGLVAVLAVLWFLHREAPPAPAEAPAPTAAVAPEPAPPEPEPAPPEPEPEPVERVVAPTAVSVSQVEGQVEMRRGAERGWTAIQGVVELGLDDAIRTGPDGRVHLVAGGHVIHLLPGTDVRVKELTADLSRFLLGAGMLSAESNTLEGTADRTLQVEVDGTDAVASTTRGRFRVSSNGDGVVAVGAQEGKVRVAARGRAVVLRAGESTLIAGGGPPSEPAPLAPSLLLKVAWPDARETNQREITVTGRTNAGALVFVAGRPVQVNQDGRFVAPVRLREGGNRVPVQAFDVAGNEVVRRGPRILVDTEGAKARFETEDLWGE